MNGMIERHVTVTRRSADGVSRADVHVTEHVSGLREASNELEDPGSCRADRTIHAVIRQDRHDAADAGDCFDPSVCCSRREQAMIAALRAYLRPDQAPECLLSRLRACLDDCCAQNRG